MDSTFVQLGVGAAGILIALQQVVLIIKAVRGTANGNGANGFGHADRAAATLLSNEFERHADRLDERHAEMIRVLVDMRSLLTEHHRTTTEAIAEIRAERAARRNGQ